MLRIGYVRLRDATAHEDSAALKAAGCQVVRAEEPHSGGHTLNSILDFIGSAAQGDILYRSASGWARLAAGTSGHFLKTNGSSANAYTPGRHVAVDG